MTPVGETVSVKLVSQCRNCPFLSKGILDLHTHTPQSISMSIHSKVYIQITISGCSSVLLGADYIIMGQVDEEGRGTLKPGAFTAPYKAQHERLLMNVSQQPC